MVDIAINENTWLIPIFQYLPKVSTNDISFMIVFFWVPTFISQHLHHEINQPFITSKMTMSCEIPMGKTGGSQHWNHQGRSCWMTQSPGLPPRKGSLDLLRWSKRFGSRLVIYAHTVYLYLVSPHIYIHNVSQCFICDMWYMMYDVWYIYMYIYIYIYVYIHIYIHTHIYIYIIWYMIYIILYLLYLWINLCGLTWFVQFGRSATFWTMKGEGDSGLLMISLFFPPHHFGWTTWGHNPQVGAWGFSFCDFWWSSLHHISTKRSKERTFHWCGCRDAWYRWMFMTCASALTNKAIRLKVTTTDSNHATKGS